MMKQKIAYKILTAAEFTALTQDRFSGAPADLADGYIHLSTSSQLSETARKHFAGQRELVVAQIDLERLGDTVRWEPSRGGEHFPHIYGPLTMAAVLAHFPLEWAADGTVKLPHG